MGLRAWFKQARTEWAEATHSCRDFDYAIYNHSNSGGIPNPLSIYGPLGSYSLHLERCKECGRIEGRKYDTYGGSSLDSKDQEHRRELWEKAISQSAH